MNHLYKITIFAGTDRILSKIGDGNFTALNTHAATAAQIAAKLTAVKAAAPDTIIPNKFTFLRSLTNNQKDHPVLYWQHSDHLGSASWITDTNGTGIQRLLYMPFGEPLYDYRNTSYNSRYTFSGKERDTETGYSYFGARYYNSDLSIWLSVDPMADKYPGLSPYTYCANNPIIYFDHDGRVIRDTKGNIVYSTTGQRKIYQHPSGSKATLEVGYIFADDGTPVQVLKNVDGDAGWNTNCHGTTFVDGQYWLNNDQVPILMEGDGYKEVTIDNAKIRDIIVYNGNSNSEHSMTITKTDGTMDGTEVYGQGGLEVNNHTDKANEAWSKPQNSTVVRKETADRVATDQEIKELNKSIPNE